jgi:hypothetical protein
MERIKLSYLAVKKCLKVENLQRQGINLFCLHDNFTLGLTPHSFSERDIDNSLTGTLDGKSLS